jgi:CRISPR-associated endonuclease Csn1
LPHLEAGKSYGDAVFAVYEVWPNSDYGVLSPGNAVNLSGLPPIDDVLKNELRNPAVHRVLAEMRKVVNALIKEHGKPDRVRIELARDLRNSKKNREKISERMRGREKQRQLARNDIENSAEVAIQNPRRGDIERYLLWKECGGVCPYTGKNISMAALYGAQFEIEHIIPWSISLDNSFANKTLCYHQVNSEKKQQDSLASLRT